MFYFIQYENGCLAASDLFHMFTQLIKGTVMQTEKALLNDRLRSLLNDMHMCPTCSTCPRAFRALHAQVPYVQNPRLRQIESEYKMDLSQRTEFCQ